MKAIQIQTPGKNSTLKIAEAATPEPATNEILVKIKAAAVNRADLVQRSGNYPPPQGASQILGMEMAGVVEKTGVNVNKWQPGDLVFGLLPGGGYAEYCTIHQDMAMPIPETMNFTEAAAVPETFLTAFQAIDWLGKLQKDETILIHAAGSGVGTSAIQLVHQLFDVQIIATAGKQHKLDTAKELGAAFAYNYKEQNYADKIVSTIGKDSIDLIIDFIGQPYWHKNIEVLNMDGRIVYLAFLGGSKLENISLTPILRKRLKVMGSTLRARSLDYKIELTTDFWQKTRSLFVEQRLQPVIDSIFDWVEAEQAHQRMQRNMNTGKIVLTGM